MKKILIFCLVCTLMLLTACQAQSPASSNGEQVPPRDPDPGSDTIRYPSEGEMMYGPQGEAIPMVSENDQKVFVKAYGAVGDGQTDDAAALKSAVASLEQGGFIYIEKGTYRLAENVTVPENITLVFAGGAMLAPDKKVTLKISGFVDADIRQIFAGKGKIEGIIRNAGYPQWFGTMDEENCFAAFQAAFDALQEVLVPGGAEYTVSNLRIEHPLRVTGQGQKQVQLNLRSNSMRLFDIRSSDVCIANFKIEGNKSKDSTIIYFNTNEADMSRITISSIWAKNTGFFLRDGESGGKHTVNDVNLYELRVDSSRSIGYHLTDFRKGIRLDNVQRQNLGVSFDVDVPGMLFCNIEDMYAADIDVTGGGGQDCKGGAVFFENCKNVTLDRAMTEAVNGNNISLKGCSGFEVNQWVIGEWNDTSLRMDDCTDIEFNLLLIIGNNYPGTTFPSDTYSPDAAHLTNCRNITFNGLNIQRFFGNGLVLEDTSGVIVNSLVGWTNCGTTLEERGSSDNNLVNCMTVGECEGKSVILKGASSKIIALTLNNGSFVEELVGPAEK